MGHIVSLGLENGVEIRVLTHNQQGVLEATKHIDDHYGEWVLARILRDETLESVAICVVDSAESVAKLAAEQIPGICLIADTGHFLEQFVIYGESSDSALSEALSRVSDVSEGSRSWEHMNQHSGRTQKGVRIAFRSAVSRKSWRK